MGLNVSNRQIVLELGLDESDSQMRADWLRRSVWKPARRYGYKAWWKWKGFGRCRAPSCAHTGEFPRKNRRFIWVL
jgi:hypothetical protein